MPSVCLFNFYSKIVSELYHLALLNFIVPPIILLAYAYRQTYWSYRKPVYYYSKFLGIKMLSLNCKALCLSTP